MPMRNLKYASSATSKSTRVPIVRKPTHFQYKNPAAKPSDSEPSSIGTSCTATEANENNDSAVTGRLGLKSTHVFHSTSSEYVAKQGERDKKTILNIHWSTVGRYVSKSTKNCYAWVERLFLSIWNCLSQLFVTPLQKDPIFFTRAEVPKVAATLGVDASFYDSATKELIDGVFEERKDKIKGHEAINWMTTIDLENYPGWTQAKIEFLWDKYQELDINGDGRLTFEELTIGLDNIGNKTSRSARKNHFDAIDQDHSGSIDFDEFCMMAYNLEKADASGGQESLFDIYKSVDRDISMIRKLDVIEQLQSGLF